MGGWGVGGIRVYYYYIYITERNNEMELNEHTQSTHLQDIFAMARVGRTTLFEIHTVEPGKKRKKGTLQVKYTCSVQSQTQTYPFYYAFVTVCQFVYVL